MTRKSHEERWNCNASNPDRDKDFVIRAGYTTIRVENQLKSAISGFRGPNEEPLYDLPITLRSVENKEPCCNQARDRLRHEVRKDTRANMS